MDDEFEMMRKEVMVSSHSHSHEISPEGLRKTMRSGRDSNRGPPEYKYETLRLEPPCVGLRW
jgi:hypothetical protein